MKHYTIARAVCVKDNNNELNRKSNRYVFKIKLYFLERNKINYLAKSNLSIVLFQHFKSTFISLFGVCINLPCWFGGNVLIPLNAISIFSIGANPNE